MADDYNETGGRPGSVALHAKYAGSDPDECRQVACNDLGELMVAVTSVLPDPLPVEATIVAPLPLPVDTEARVVLVDTEARVVQTNESLFSTWGAIAEQVSTQNTIGEVLASQATTGGFTVTAEHGNTGAVFLGDSTSTCFVQLVAGSSMSFSLDNTNKVYFRTPTTGDGVVVFYWTI